MSGVDEDTIASLEERIEALEDDVEAAGTEDDLDDCESTLESIRDDVGEIEVEEPADDEDWEDPLEPLEDRLDDAESAIEDQRGPYTSDVTSAIEDSRATVVDTRWTEAGAETLASIASSFATALGDSLEEPPLTDERGDERLAAALEESTALIEAADLDPDEDAATIEALLEAVGDLEDDVEGAEAWTDLEVREQLRRDGFYDVLDHVKDFPPELAALKVHEQEGNAEMILLALESFGSDFMEEHCLDALERLGPEVAREPMLERAERRDQAAISILGTIGSDDEEVVATVTDYVDAGDDHLRRTALRVLGQIGASDALQEIADQLEADNPDVRSTAARALGLVGDTRAIAPLEAVLAEDETDRVRGSAAWALVQIGTAEALEAAAAYADDDSYLVQAEAERATRAT